uniref:Probable cytosol aminopeptidase n=1 Tax=candidate division WOR-3 bacterium TaxID=2052148 RepID=A0A7V3UZR1_UNCW3
MQIELISRKRWQGRVSAALMFENEPRPLGIEPAGFQRVVLMNESFNGKFSETTAGIDALKRRLIISGLGKRSEFELDRVRVAVARLLSRAGEFAESELGLLMPKAGAVKVKPERFVEAVVEGAILSSYRFSRYRQLKPEEQKVVKRLVLVYNSDEELKQAKSAVAEAERRCAAVCYVRDLVNEPAANKAPLKIAELAKELTVPERIEVRVLDKAVLEEMGMNGILAVGQGSRNPPCLVQLTYTPKGKSKGTLIFVGKGICFDSGGLSLKNAQQMENMKDDMAGAATVFGIFKYLQEADLPYTVVGLTPLAENMPDGSAQKVGDIIRHYNGKTVEVANTDAEGRLILADALAYGATMKPDLMIDIATLTGACVVALGNECAGLLGNDAQTIARLISLGKEQGELFWELPLIERYRSHMKSEVADLKNIGKPMNAGTIIGGLFLSEFVPGEVKWVHIDIAGTAFTSEPRDYCPAGATGIPLRTLLSLLKNR